MEQMKAELVVVGDSDFNPDHLKSTLGVVPDQIYHIGDAIGRSAMRHTSNSWIISTGYSKFPSLAACVGPLLERLEPFRDQFLAMLPRNVELQLSVAVYVHESVPELNLSVDLVRSLANLGASIDIDVILV